LRSRLAAYLSSGHGSLLSSGAYIASDARTQEEQQWLSIYLKTVYDGTNLRQDEEQMTGLGSQFAIYRQLNDRHYAAWHPDVFRPTGAAFGAMQYASGQLAAVAYKGSDFRTFTMAFPNPTEKNNLRTLVSI